MRCLCIKGFVVANMVFSLVDVSERNQIPQNVTVRLGVDVFFLFCSSTNVSVHVEGEILIAAIRCYAAFIIVY